MRSEVSLTVLHEPKSTLCNFIRQYWLLRLDLFYATPKHNLMQRFSPRRRVCGQPLRAIDQARASWRAE